MARNSILGILVVSILAVVASGPLRSQEAPRKAPVLTVNGQQFRDLNKNGTLDAYEDRRVPVERRVADLLSRMTLEEKAGLMIHTSLSGFTGPNGEVLGVAAAGGRGGRGGAPSAPATGAARVIQGRPNMNNVEPMGPSANPQATILQRNIRWILVRPNAGEVPQITARFHNGLQEIAESSRLGIPLVFSSDPRHGGGRGGSTAAPNISQWPDQLGLAATGDADLVREFGRIAAQELRALGIQCTLSPMADIATEPRWNRISGTFGEDGDLVAKLTRAYVEGFQGKQLGPESVLTIVKHFPGDGPAKDGLDGHNYYGKWASYPGNNFDYHLLPFKAAIEVGAGGAMGAYFIPVGHDTVGVNFSKSMIADLLREKLGFQGVVVTDWLRNMPWGVEKLTEKERQKMMVMAGVDQIGGDNDPKYIIELARDGSVPAAVIDAAARRVLRAMFQLGVFENPYVDPARTATVVASRPFLAAGYAAQVKSTVLLKNSGNLLPVAPSARIYVEGIDKDVAARYGTVVDDPKQAAVAIIRVASPNTVFPYGGGFAGGGGRGAGGTPPVLSGKAFGTTLSYQGASNQSVLEDIRKLVASGTKTVVVVNMDRPVILTEFIDDVAGAFAAFGASDAALLDVVFGKASPTGKLPYDLPSDMPSVLAQAEDLPHDVADPLFKFGFGLTYTGR